MRRNRAQKEKRGKSTTIPYPRKLKTTASDINMSQKCECKLTVIRYHLCI